MADYPAGFPSGTATTLLGSNGSAGVKQTLTSAGAAMIAAANAGAQRTLLSIVNGTDLPPSVALEGDSLVYQLLNMMGGAFLIVNSFHYKAFPSVAVNVVWIGIAIYTMTRRKLVK